MARFFLRNTQTGGGTGGSVYDLSETQGTGSTLGSGNNTSASFIEMQRWQVTVDDTVGGTSFPTSINMSAVSASTLEWRYRVQRLNSSNTVQASSGYSSTYNTAGTKTETLTLSTTWAAGDRLAISIELRRVSGTGNRTYTLNVNNASTYVDATIDDGVTAGLAIAVDSLELDMAADAGPVPRTAQLAIDVDDLGFATSATVGPVPRTAGLAVGVDDVGFAFAAGPAPAYEPPYLKAIEMGRGLFAIGIVKNG
jgi:hypothetical protein